MAYKEYGATIAPSNVSNTGFPIAMGTHIGGGRIVYNKDTLNSKHWCLLGEGATLSNQKANAIGQIWYDTLDSKYWKLGSWPSTDPVWVDVSTIFATRSYVDTAINDIPDPMIFKGSLGTGGTITTLPTASSSNTGFTYKVITAGTYAGQVAKIGDTFISDGTTWNLIPSGDDSGGGSVTSITLNATSPILIDNSAAITTSGTRTFSHDSSSGNKHIPSGGSANQILKWSADGTAVWGNDVNTHYTSKNIVSSSAVGTTNTNTTNPYLNHIEESTVTSSHRINGSGATTVNSDLGGNITINSTDTNTTYSFAPGTTNGTFSVTPSGGSATAISIYGLNTAAYTASGDYATSSHGHTVFSSTKDGFVPKSGTSTTSDFLRSDGTWVAPPNNNSTTHLYVGASGTNTNGTTTNGNTYIKLFDDTTAREQHKISGNGPSVVTSDATGNIIVGISDNSIGATQLNVTGNGTTTQYLRSDGDGSFTWADIPILNQNTSGSAGSVISSITFNNGGTGAASEITYNGSTARTISYNTIGAAASSHTHSTYINQTITSGNGMAAWTATNGNLTIALGTPSTIIGSSTNSLTSTSHTHAISLTPANIGAAPSTHTHDYSLLDNLPAIYNAIHNGVPYGTGTDDFDSLYSYQNDVWLCSHSMRNGPYNDEGYIDTNYNTAFDNCVVQQFGDGYRTTKIQVLYITTGDVVNLSKGAIFYRMQGDKWKRIATYSDIENLQSQINSLVSTVNSKQDKRSIASPDIGIAANGTATITPIANKVQYINLNGGAAIHTIDLNTNYLNSLDEYTMIITNPNNAGRLVININSSYKFVGILPSWYYNSWIICIWKGMIFANTIN